MHEKLHASNMQDRCVGDLHQLIHVYTLVLVYSGSRMQRQRLWLHASMQWASSR